MAYTDAQLQNMSLEELEALDASLGQAETPHESPDHQMKEREAGPQKYSDDQLENMSLEELEQINDSMKAPEPSIMDHVGEGAKELLWAPYNALASVGDLLSSPVRAGIEKLGGPKLRSLGEIRDQAQGQLKTGTGRAIRKTSETAGDMFSLMPAGRAVGIGGKALQAANWDKVGRGTSWIARNILGEVPKTVAGAKELAKAGAKAGATSGVLQEMGVPGLAADFAYPGKDLAKYGWKATKNKFSKATAEAKRHNEASDVFQETVGKEKVPQVLEALENPKEFVEGYNPTTAEVTGNAGLIKSERALQGIHDPLAERHAENMGVLRKSIEDMAPQGAHVEHTQEFAAKHKTKEDTAALKARERAEAKALKAQEQAEMKAAKAQEKAEEKARKTHEKAETQRNKHAERFVGEKAKPTAEEVGKEIHQGVHEKHGKYKQQRSEASKPAYDALDTIKETFPVSKTEAHIDDLIKEHTGDIKDRFVSLKKDLDHFSAHGNSIDRETQNYVNELKKENFPDHLIEKALKSNGMEMPQKTPPTPKQFNEWIKTLNSEIKAAKKSTSLGANQLHKKLTDLKSTALAEQATHFHPQIQAHSEIYAKHSVPINKIESSEALGQILGEVRKGYAVRPQLQEADVTALFNKGRNSPQNARELVQTLGYDHSSLEKMRGHMRNDFAEKVIDASGNVNQTKLNTWLRNTPSAGIIDKNIMKDVRALGKSQEKATAFKKQYEGVVKEGAKPKPKPKAAAKPQPAPSEHEKAFTALLGPNMQGVNADRIVGPILKNTNSEKLMKEVVTLAKKDTTGKAMKGLEAGIAHHMLEKATVNGATLKGEHNFSFDKMKTLIKDSEGALKEVYGEKGYNNLVKVFDALAVRNKLASAGAGGNSHTVEKGANLINLFASSVKETAIKKGLAKIPYLGVPLNAVHTAMSEFRKGHVKQLVTKALMEPEFAKALLSHVEVPKVKLPSYVGQLLARPILPNGKSRHKGG